VCPACGKIVCMIKIMFAFDSVRTLPLVLQLLLLLQLSSVSILILIHCKVTIFDLGFALFISGELFTKAVSKVKSDGVYQYKKGSSRSSSQNDSASEEKPVKRAKLMSTERNREIENLSNLIASVEDSIRTKQLQL